MDPVRSPARRQAGAIAVQKNIKLYENKVEYKS